MGDKGIAIVKWLLVIVLLALVIIGQRTVGKVHLGVMVAGLAGLLALLGSYNRKYL